MCLDYGSAKATFFFQQRVIFLTNNDINVHFYMRTIQSSLLGTSLQIKKCIKMLLYQPSIHHPTVHSYGLEKPKKSLPARWTGRQPAGRFGAPVPRCCAEKGRVLYTVIWALMDKRNAAPAAAKRILRCSIFWWCWSLEIIHWLLLQMQTIHTYLMGYDFGIVLELQHRFCGKISIPLIQHPTLPAWKFGNSSLKSWTLEILCHSPQILQGLEVYTLVIRKSLECCFS